MNFFKSILLDDEDHPKTENHDESDPISSVNSPHEDRDSYDHADDGNAGGWSFGGLIKTLASQSESVIETYRRDLKEFGSGLQKETEVIREAASRAVKDLPASIEAGTSAAQGVLDGVLKTTAEIISKESQIFASDGEPETPETNRKSGRYSWFDTQLSAIQSDLNTYCEEPEDVEEYRKWKLGFELESRNDEIEALIRENGTLESVYRKIVPNGVDHETFWCRYFYRVDKLTQQESLRANLIKRAISIDDEDELSWDVDDDEYENGNGSELPSNVNKDEDVAKDKGVTDGSSNLVQKGDVSNSGLVDVKEGGNINTGVDDNDKNNGVESSKENMEDVKEMKSEEASAVKSDEKVKSENEMKSEEVSAVNSDEKVKSDKEMKSEASAVKSEEKVKFEEESVGNKNNENVSVEKDEKNDVSDDIGWDEIEDIGSGDEKKISSITNDGSPNRAELRKRLSAADDDEDLSWDIEDDDDPVKA